jgi:DNA polymerase-3 subunit alpha
MAQPRFIHLRVHSEHSLLEGAVPVKKLPKLAAEAGMPAVALTDSNALFAALEFSDYAAKSGVQPIIGAQLDLCYLPPEPGRPPYRPPRSSFSARARRGG